MCVGMNVCVRDPAPQVYPCEVPHSLDADAALAEAPWFSRKQTACNSRLLLVAVQKRVIVTVSIFLFSCRLFVFSFLHVLQLLCEHVAFFYSL